MKFSNPINYSGEIKYSPDNSLLAFTKQNNLLVYDTKALELKKSYTFTDFPSKIEWSSGSDLLLIGFFLKSQLEVKDLNNDYFNCKLDEKFYGISDCFLTPFATKIIVVNDFGLGTKLYKIEKDKLIPTNLISNTKKFKNIPQGYNNPSSETNKILYKASYTANTVFSITKKLVGFLQRVEHTDFVSIFKFNNSYLPKKDKVQVLDEEIELVTFIECSTQDMIRIEFTKDELFIIVFDSIANNLIEVFNILGQIKAKINPYKYKLGHTAYSLSDNYLAIGYHDDSIRVYHTTSWNLVSEYSQKTEIEIDENLTVFKEQNSMGNVQYELIEQGNLIFEVSEKQGFKYFQFSLNELYLACVSLSNPTTIFIFKSESAFSLVSVIIQNFKVTDLSFMFGNNNQQEYISKTGKQEQRSQTNENDSNFNLVIASENKNLYLVSPSEASVCPIPINKKENIFVTNILWAYDSSSLICYNSSNFFYSKLVTIDEYIEEEVQEEEENEEENDEQNDNQNDDEYNDHND